MKWPYLGIAEALAEVLRTRRLVLPREDIRDVAAAALSSQLVFFAGPSGTGKSVVADAASELLTHPRRRMKLQLPMAISSEAELYGYSTTIGGTLQFQPSKWLDKFLRLQVSAGAAASSAGPPVISENALPAAPSSPEACAPVISIEEANLGVIDGYLSSFMRDFSGQGACEVEVVLHSKNTGLKRTDDVGDAPPVIRIARWPRIFATLNVDHTSEPPARKVAARGLVLVFEPQAFSEAELASAATASGAAGGADDHYQQALMSPTAHAELLRNDDSSQFDSVVFSIKQMAEALSTLTRTHAVASPRSLVRIVEFLAAFVMISLADGQTFDEAKACGLEYGLLHVILPALPEPFFLRFRDEILKQSSSALAPMTAIDADRSPLLSRLTRAQETGGTDFWAAFS